MKVLDSTFLIDWLDGVESTKNMVSENEILFTTQINMFELIRGFFIRKIPDEKWLKIMRTFFNLKVLQLNDDAVVLSANIFTELMKKGHIIPDNDILIAGISLSYGANKIVTSNIKHFENIKGLEVVEY